MRTRKILKCYGRPGACHTRSSMRGQDHSATIALKCPVVNTPFIRAAASQEMPTVSFDQMNNQAPPASKPISDDA